MERTERITRRSLIQGAAGIGLGVAFGGRAGASFAARSSSPLLSGITAYAQELVFGTAGQIPLAVGCAYAAIDGPHHVVGAFGALSSSPNSPRARANSLFEIGSVTKVFTSTLLAQTVQSPAAPITLDTPIGRYLPQGVRNRNVKNITFGDLASYSNCLVHTAPDQNSPSYTIPELVKFLNNGAKGKNGKYIAPMLSPFICTPGWSYWYSNLGVGLLGYLLGKVWHTSWANLVKSNITGPLHMHDTVRTPDAQQLRRLAKGYGPHGAVKPGTAAPFLGGGGILKSTSHDMLRFLGAQLDPGHAPQVLRTAIPATWAQQHPGPPPVGLGWFLDRTTGGQPAFTKDGGTGGFGSYIAFVPAARQGAFLVTNFRHLAGGPKVRSLLGIPSTKKSDLP